MSWRAPVPRPCTSTRRPAPAAPRFRPSGLEICAPLGIGPPTCHNLSQHDLDFPSETSQGNHTFMQPDRFTTNSQEPLQAAQRLADDRRNPQTTPEHLLAVLLEQEGGVVVPVLRKLGVDPAAVRQTLGPALDGLPTLSATSSAEPAGGSTELAQITRAAETEMR